MLDVATPILEAGARPGEICRLKCENIDLERGCLAIPFGKTKARRKIPLTARARAVLEKRMAEAEGDYIFAGGRGVGDAGRPIRKAE